MLDLAAIPSPSQGVWHLGPFPVRAYALCIIAGIGVAVWLTERRWVARGGRPGVVGDVAVWAVPFGLIGGRLYHVVTDPELYFTKGKDWVDAFYVWHGGLGIWGAIALGAVGVWIGVRRAGLPFGVFADAAAPGIVLAQGIGRLGNYFNQELYGRPTHLPWALHITHSAEGGPAGYYHPTFLYELLWDVGTAALVIWADRRFRLGHGRAFALYVAAYTAGRFWIEALRVDPAHHFLGLRLNDWTSIVLFVAAVGYLVARRHAGREDLAALTAAADARRGVAPAVGEPADPDPEPAGHPADPDPEPAGHPADPDPGPAGHPADPDPGPAGGGWPAGEAGRPRLAP